MENVWRIGFQHPAHAGAELFDKFHVAENAHEFAIANSRTT